METQKVSELQEITTISTQDSLPILTDEIDNVVDRITIDNLLTNIISTDDNNALKQGVDNKLYVGSAINLYDSEYSYSEGQWVLVNGIMYKSKVDDNIDNPVTDDAYWEKVNFGGGGDELNNPFSLFDSRYSDHELKNLSWLRSNGQWNSGTVYVNAYQLLLKLYNGTEVIEGITVKAVGDSSITDYDFVIDTANTQFKLPIKTNLASGKAVVGNGMSLGLTDGTHFASLANATSDWTLTDSDNYGAEIGVSRGTHPLSNGTIGITTDATKSGMELADSNLYLYYYVGETVQNANLIDVGRIQEQLANKLDRGNKEEIISWGMPDYSAGVTLAKANGEAPLDGYIKIGTVNNVSSFTITVANSVFKLSGEYMTSDMMLIPINKGETYTCTNWGGVNTMEFIPMKGAN